MAINRELVQAWIDWLEDPSHEQTQQMLCMLKSNGSKAYCCLGGLAEVLKLEMVKTEELYSGGDRMKLGGEYKSAHWHAVLPPEQWDKLGIETGQGYFWDLNDFKHYSFKQIAGELRHELQEVV